MTNTTYDKKIDFFSFHHPYTKMNTIILQQFDLLIHQLNEEIKKLKKEGTDPKNQHFRLKALKTARKAIGSFSEEINSSSQLSGVSGIGEGVLKRVEEILQTGKLQEVQQPEQLPATEDAALSINVIQEVERLQTVIDIGATMANKLIKKHITLPVLLEAWTKQDQTYLSKLTHGQLLGLKYYGDSQKRIPRDSISHFEQQLQPILSQIDPHLQFTICGSYRRGMPDSGDIDVLFTHPVWVTSSAIGSQLQTIVQLLHQQGILVDDLTIEGNEKYMGFIQLPTMVARIDLLCMPISSYVSGMLYFTGSKEENIRLRKLAIKKKMKINQNGLFKDDKIIPLAKEQDLYELLEIPYKEPTKR